MSDHKRLQRKRDCWWKKRKSSVSCWFLWTPSPADTNKITFCNLSSLNVRSVCTILNWNITGNCFHTFYLAMERLCWYLFQHTEERSLGRFLHFELISVQFLHIRVQVRLQVHLFIQPPIDMPEHCVKGTRQNTRIFWRACAHTDTSTEVRSVNLYITTGT